MHYGIEVVPFGEYSNPRLVMELAQAAEAAGWEAITLWDHLLFPYGAGDPWVTLSAVAAVTKRIKLCTGVAPLPRYKPQVLARTLVGLDILSAGRVIFGTGAGVDFDFTPFGEAVDARTRAAMLDEGLELLDGLVVGRPCYLSWTLLQRRSCQTRPRCRPTATYSNLDRRRQQSRLPPCSPLGWLDHRHDRTKCRTSP